MRSERGFFLVAVGLVFCLFLLPHAWALADEDDDDDDDGDGGARIVSVDCEDGDSINEELAKHAYETQELTIEITGICDEDVEIRRDNVTLIGTDPSTDGLRGVGDGTEEGEGMVQVRDARNIRLENLLLTEAARNALVATDINIVEVVNCRFVDNARGVAVARGAVRITDSVFIDNPTFGVGAFDGGVLLCDGCDVSGSGTAVVAILARLSAQNSSFSDGASAFTNGEIRIVNSTLMGSVFATTKSLVELTNVTQTNPAGFNLIEKGSTLSLRGSAAGEGIAVMEDFSELLIRGSSTYTGDLICSSGSDAFCDVPANVVGASNCGLCPVP